MFVSQPTKDGDPWWRDVPAAVSAVVLVSGVVVYGLLATAYDKFYRELGLTPTDVGVQYGRTLAGAAALTVLVVAGLAILTGLLFFLIRFRPRIMSRWYREVARREAWRASWAWSLALVVGSGVVVGGVLGGGTTGVQVAMGGFTVGVVATALLSRTWLRSWGPASTDGSPSAGEGAARENGGPSHEHNGSSQEWGRDVRIALAASMALAAVWTWVLLTTWLYASANSRADAVKERRWVQPPQVGGLTVFSVRAMPTVLEASTDSPADLDLVARLGHSGEEPAGAEEMHQLMYLGTANGLLVIYDATDHETLMLPGTQFRAPVINCETKQAKNSLCRE